MVAMPPLQTYTTPSPRCLDLIRVSENAPIISLPEGSHVDSYWDVDAYSIGFGHHSSIITRNTIWALDQVNNQFLQDAQQACSEVLSKVELSLTQGELDACIDFVFEFGIGRFASSTLLQVINSGDFDSVPAQLRLWVHVKDAHGIEQISTDLQLRREREIMLFKTGDWK